jgi:hypothetical protein
MSFDQWYETARLEVHGIHTVSDMQKAYTAGVQAERERCAVKAWSIGMDLFAAEPNTKIDPRVVGSMIATAIRKEARE